MWVRKTTEAFSGCQNNLKTDKTLLVITDFQNTTVELPKASTAAVPIGCWRYATLSVGVILLYEFRQVTFTNAMMQIPLSQGQC